MLPIHGRALRRWFRRLAVGAAAVAFAATVTAQAGVAAAATPPPVGTTAPTAPPRPIGDNPIGGGNVWGGLNPHSVHP